VVPTHKQVWQQLHVLQGSTFSFGPEQTLEGDFSFLFSFFLRKKKQNPQTFNSTHTANLIYYFITH
jgi:hypothetical protein